MPPTTRASDAERRQREYAIDTDFLNHFLRKYDVVENKPWYLQYVIHGGDKMISRNPTSGPHKQSLETRLQKCENNFEKLERSEDLFTRPH